MKFLSKIAFLSILAFADQNLVAFDEKSLREGFPCYNDYNTVSVMDQNFHGWYLNAEPIQMLIHHFKPKVVVELGAWLGLSTLHIANLLPEDGKVFTVDHWYTPPYDVNIPDYYSVFDIKNLYQQFLSNVIHCGMQKKIVPVLGSTTSGCEQLKKNGIIPDLIYVDADHEEEGVYRDLCNYFPLIKGHGIICGDDYCWNLSNTGYPVKKAVDRFARENNLDVIVPNGVLWILKEK